MNRLKSKHIARFLAVIAGRPWLHLMETSAVRIPERIAEFDGDLFVVRNVAKRRFEVHDASVPVRSMSYVLQADELDMRVYYRLLEAQMARNPLQRAEQATAEEQASRDRWFSDQTHMFARDFADAVRIDTDMQHVFPAVKPAAS